VIGKDSNEESERSAQRGGRKCNTSMSALLPTSGNTSTKGLTMSDVKHFKMADRLKSGLPVTIRAVRPDDKDKINEAFHNLEPDTIYTRYFRYKTSLSDAELKWATELDF
jgi:hypothetical protein